ncbi:MAG: prephenate dehydratase [Rhodobacteraceae bacterium]|nr:prephenate dehydratase [Paracoccaceae bacterium]
MTGHIAFQGELGAYGHQACFETYPNMTPLPCPSFEDAIEAVRNGAADLGMIGVENSTFGRVAEVHQLLPASGLHIVDEAFVRVHINLLAVPGANMHDLKRVRSMYILLGQARGFLREHGLKTLNWADNAAAARDVAELGDVSEGALASEMAAQVYGLDILAHHIEDHARNTTRFLVMARDEDRTRRGEYGMMSSLVFRVKNLPAALYKAMGGFATNGINITKLESYMVDGHFTATQFYAEIEGHPDDENVVRALEELDHFTDMIRILGVYPAAARRRELIPER